MHGVETFISSLYTVFDTSDHPQCSTLQNEFQHKEANIKEINMLILILRWLFCDVFCNSQ